MSLKEYRLKRDFKRTTEPKVKLTYFIFDVLWFNSSNIEKIPLLDRKKILKKAIPRSEFLHYNGHVKGNGKKLFRTAQRKGLEGIIGKRNDSLYYEDTRTSNSVKIKTELRQEAVICGFTEPKGSRKYFGSLMLGIYDKSKLTYIGHTGTGFDFKSLKDIYAILIKYKQKESPFSKVPKTNSPVTWLRPVLICEVKFSSWTNEKMMRHLVFIALRGDKNAKDVVRERSR